MHPISRVIWLLINLFFGIGLAFTLFLWVACDMQMPLILKDLIATYIPILSPIFDVPYVQIPQFASSVIGKLSFNALLCTIFGFVHTVFAQESVQIILRRYFAPKQTLRTIYSVLVTITAFIIMGFWQHTHIQLWHWLPSTITEYDQHILLLIIYSIFSLPIFYVLIIFDLSHFAGVKQIFEKIESINCPYTENRTSGNATLVTTGLFRLCRHPIYLFTILAGIITPVMSLDRLMFAVYMSMYLVIGVPIEERKLIQIFGQDYVNYQKRTPMIVPFLTSKSKQN